MATEAPVRSGASFTMKGFFVMCSAIVTRLQPLGVAYPAKVPTMTDIALANPAIAPADLWTFFVSSILLTVLGRLVIAVISRACGGFPECRQGGGRRQPFRSAPCPIRLRSV